MPKSILDKDFKYVRSTDTDLRKTFARIRREQAKVIVKQQQVVRPLTVVVKKK